LIDKTNALDVYFEDQIQILVHEPDLFVVDGVKGVLAANKIQYSKIEKSKGL